MWLTNWFALKNLDDTVIFVTVFITGSKKVRLITDEFVLLQSWCILRGHQADRRAI